MDCKKVQFNIASCYEHISLVTKGLCAMIRSVHDDDALLGAVELCFVEVANNTVEHAYHDENNHEIVFKLELSTNEVSLLIVDSGKSMPLGTMEKEIDWDSLDKDDIDSWETSGRGLQIVKDLMDEVSYWTESECNYFKMVKKIA